MLVEARPSMQADRPAEQPWATHWATACCPWSSRPERIAVQFRRARLAGPCRDLTELGHGGRGTRLRQRRPAARGDLVRVADLRAREGRQARDRGGRDLRARSTSCRRCTSAAGSARTGTRWPLASLAQSPTAAPPVSRHAAAGVPPPAGAAPGPCRCIGTTFTSRGPAGAGAPGVAWAAGGAGAAAPDASGARRRSPDRPTARRAGQPQEKRGEPRIGRSSLPPFSQTRASPSKSAVRALGHLNQRARARSFRSSSPPWPPPSRRRGCRRRGPRSPARGPGRS